jgi:hypothetical protein
MKLVVDAKLFYDEDEDVADEVLDERHFEVKGDWQTVMVNFTEHACCMVGQMVSGMLESVVEEQLAYEAEEAEKEAGQVEATA